MDVDTSFATANIKNVSESCNSAVQVELEKLIDCALDEWPDEELKIRLR